jgi:hypothetical protein
MRTDDHPFLASASSSRPAARPRRRALRLLPVVAAALLVAPGGARAHCDTLDGPVVTAARAALETGKLAPVLAWVRPADEGELRAAFASARAARRSGKEAREVADRWFLETVVRVHRAGEGAPYTGLKPAGAIDPAVAAADRAVAAGDAAALERLLVAAVRDGLHAHLARLGRERPPADDVEAGRRWVAAYVPFVHWAEGVYAAAAASAAHDHAPAPRAAGADDATAPTSAPEAEHGTAGAGHVHGRHP